MKKSKQSIERRQQDKKAKADEQKGIVDNRTTDS